MFQDYALRGIDVDRRNLDPSDKRNYLSKRLEIFLRYVYANKEGEAWAFFEREYALPDKEEMRSRIKAVLKDEPVYKYIHKNMLHRTVGGERRRLSP